MWVMGTRLLWVMVSLWPCVDAGGQRTKTSPFIEIDCGNVTRPRPVSFLAESPAKVATHLPCSKPPSYANMSSHMHVAYLSIGRSSALAAKRAVFTFAAVAHIERVAKALPVIYHLVTREGTKEMRRRLCQDQKVSPLHAAGKIHLHSLQKAPVAAAQMHAKLEALASGNGRMYLWKNVLHLLLPKWLPRVMFLDADLFFVSDPTLLWRQFDLFAAGQHIGMAVEESWSRQEVYLQGGVSFNSGVLLMDLDGLRQSQLYANLLTKYSLPGSTKLGWTADQNLFSDMSTNQSGGRSLFYTLPCGFNMQTSTHQIPPRGEGSARAFKALHRCITSPCHIIHGNEFESKKVLWQLLDRPHDRSSCLEVLQQHRCHVDPFRKQAPAARMHGLLARQCCNGHHEGGS